MVLNRLVLLKQISLDLAAEFNSVSGAASQQSNGIFRESVGAVMQFDLTNACCFIV